MSLKKVRVQYHELQKTNSVLKPEHSPECRICMESQSQSNEQVRAPCKCEGSVKYVHLSCLKKWIREGLKQKKLDEVNQKLEEGMPCQICKSAIYFNISYRTVCDSYEINKSKIISKKLLFVLMIIILICALSAIAYCIIELLPVANQQESVKFIILISALGILGILLVFLLYFISGEFCFSLSLEVDQVSRLIRGKRVPLSRMTDMYPRRLQVQEVE